MDHDVNQLIEKNSSGSTIFSYFLNQDVGEVNALKYDGYYFWSLERQGTAGFRIRKWEIGTDDLVRVVDEFSYASDVVNQYDAHAFAVEYYRDTLSNSFSIGQSVLTVTDGSIIRVGDQVIIGPSDAVGFEGLFNTVDVIAKAGTSITISPSLSTPFSANTPLYFTRNFFVFNDTGALYKYSASSGAILTLNTSNIFNKVRASVFFKNHLMFVRAGEVIWLDPDSQNINKSQAINNLNESRTDHIEASDLAGFSDTLYRLEQQHVFFDTPNQQWDTEDWSPLYNYNTSNTVAEVYFVAVHADPPIVHRVASGVAVNDTKAAITVQVFDQFRTPVFNRLVTFSSTGGSLSPSSGTTDSEGIFRSTYTANSTAGQAIITATVT